MCVCLFREQAKGHDAVFGHGNGSVSSSAIDLSEAAFL